MPRTSLNTDPAAINPAAADVDFTLPDLVEADLNDPEPEVFSAEEGYVVEDEAVKPETETKPAVADHKEEDEAREFGWVNKEEWVAQGKPEKNWRPASDFNAFRQQAAPVLARENRELRARLAKIEKDNQIKSDADAEARQNIVRESLNLRFQQAKDNNDWDEAFKVQQEMVDLKFAEAAKPKPQPAQPDPETAEAFKNFVARNKIVETDTKLQRALARQVKLILDTGTGSDDAATTLDDAWDEVKRMYPEKFRRQTAPMADTGGTTAAHVNGRSWNDLKPDVKKEYERFLRDNPQVKRENLMKRFPPDYYRS